MKMFHLKSNENRRSLNKIIVHAKTIKSVIVGNLFKFWTLRNERIKTHKTISHG